MYIDKSLEFVILGKKKKPSFVKASDGKEVKMRKRFLIVLLSVICLIGYLKLYEVNTAPEKQASIIKLIPFGQKISRDVEILNALGKMASKNGKR
jgi:hypothetical protein